MKSLFDTAADKLPQELQVLREVLWASWEDDALPRETWIKQIGARAHPDATGAFRELVKAGVLVMSGEKFKLDKDA